MSLKEEGEALAKLALERGRPASKQIRRLYIMTKSRSTDDIEAFIKYQTPRVYGWEFGEETLRILERYRNEPEKFRKVLRHALMSYGYLNLKSFMNLRPQIIDVIKRVCQRYGLRDVEFSAGEKGKRISVALSNFYGPPGPLNDEIYIQIMRAVPKASEHRFRIWIQKRR